MEDQNKKNAIGRLVDDITAQLAKLKLLIEEYVPSADGRDEIKEKAAVVGSIGGSHQGTVIEGVFDGQNMVDPEGKVYTVPANYASKSKLVGGDILKLTIQPDGSFLYKQIGPVQRRRMLGTLVHDEQSRSFRAVTADGRSFRLLLASVTYFKGEPGDDVVMLVPIDMVTRWAAVENIVRQMSEEDRAVYAADGDELHQPELLSDGNEAELPLGADIELPAADD